MKRPSFQFYPADWRKDMALQSCSVAARGLWIDMLCIAHECEPYGHLTVNGKPMTPAQIGRHTGLTERECVKLIGELTDAGVVSVNDSGVMFSRRMVRDEQARETRAEIGRANGAKGAEHGKKGGEYGALGGRPRKHANPDKNGGEEPGQKPPQNPRPSSSSSTSVKDISEPNGSSSAAPTVIASLSKLPDCPAEEIVGLYHDILPTLPRVRLMTDDRRRAMRRLWQWLLTKPGGDGKPRARDSESALTWLRGFFEQAGENDFLMGRTTRSGAHAGWVCDFDFLLSTKGMKQVIEKTYVGEEAAA